MSTTLYVLGRWAYRHYRRVIAGWLLLLVVAGLCAAAFGSGTRDDFNIPGTESQDTFDALERTFPQLSGASAFLVVDAPEGRTVDDQQSQRLINDAVADLEDVPRVADVISPYSDLTDIGISSDRSSAQIQIQFTDQLTKVTQAQKDEVLRADDALADAGFETAFGGDIFINTGPPLSPIELVGVALAFIVLYLIFRSVKAAALPIVTALIGVLVAVAITWALTDIVTISTTAPLLALMIGLAVGIDYALFIVSRHREHLSHGVEPEEAAARATATAGSAVTFAGVTVVIALVALAVAGIPFLAIMGVVAAFAVVVAVVVAVTLLPATLALFGTSITPRSDLPEPGNFSRRWVAATTRFPLLAIATIFVGLAIVALPTQDLKLALVDNGKAPEDTTQRIAFDLVEEHFGPGYNGPLLVVADIITSTDPLGLVDELEAEIASLPGVEAIGLATPNETGDTALIQVIPETGPSDEATKDLVAEIRDRAPQWEAEHDIVVGITGLTAAGIDVSERLQSALLPYGIVVVGLSVLLLAIVFRSLVVPFKATVGYLLSTGASFGAVVAVFQWGWLGPLVNLDQTGPLISFLPIMLMGVLFGLSMDYEVFLMSRIKEEYVQSDDPDKAIVDGFVGSSRVVTAAAVIMLAVFAAFVPDSDPGIKPVAFALAIGVFCDAFLVRMLFAPAVMKLFGRKAWQLPRRLDRVLPHLDVEGDAIHRQLDLAAWPRPGSTAAVAAAGLTASTHAGPIYNDVAVEVPRGGRLVVHGPIGSGKTALLLTIAGRMKFDSGRLRVNGFLLPQESGAVRRSVALAEIEGVNDLEPNLTVDQHIAERLSIGTFGLWVSGRKIVPVRDELNRVLTAAHADHGVPFEPLSGGELVAQLRPLERAVFSVVLAMSDQPAVLVVDDVDDLRTAREIALLWSAIDHAIADRDVTLVASVHTLDAVPQPTDRFQLLELDTARTLDELML